MLMLRADQIRAPGVQQLRGPDDNRRLWHRGVVDLDLAQVRAFVAVVEHRHFGRAAESLNLTQQALSKRVARLEQRLGRLLDRRRGGITLTAAGERFLPGARRMLEVADRAVADIQ
jgi:DNA-binding transcriptional LysR family regulator